MAVTEPTIAIADLSTEYHRRGMGEWSDARLVAEIADVLSRPRVEPADSFVLHAPLELAARAALLPRVAPDDRERARLRVFAVAAEYEAFGPALPEAQPRDFNSNPDAAARLRAAIEAGDLYEVDAVAAWLGRSATQGELRDLLADDIVPRLSAAAHGPIFLYQLPRVAPRGEMTGQLLRALAREVARQPDWRLTWPNESTASGWAPSGALFDALAATPRLGLPGSDFIFPLMSQVDGAIATDLLAGLTTGADLDGGARMILRAAAWSMLQEPPEYAPYGWSHCLTMPQAVLGIAGSCTDPTLALAVAATYVVGFRAGLSARPLTADPPPEGEHDVTELVTRAAVQRDAHLVKYTLACLDAAAWDRAYANLYLAAAASLGDYWAERGDDDDATATVG